MNDYYVYSHECNGLIFYIGKGRKSRCSSVRNRSKKWRDFVQNINNNFQIRILYSDLSNDEALRIESELIATTENLTNTSKSNLRLDYDLIKWEDLYYYDESSPSGLRYKRDNSAINPANKRFAGDVAGYQKFYANGKPQEWTIRVGTKSFRAHIIVMILHHVKIGKDDVINHIDSNPHNNKFNNLETCSVSENMQRTRRHTNPSPNFMISDRIRKSIHGGIHYEHRYLRVRYTEDGVRKFQDFSFLKYGEDCIWNVAREFRDQILLTLY